jgi:hypothetical protein
MTVQSFCFFLFLVIQFAFSAPPAPSIRSATVYRSLSESNFRTFRIFRSFQRQTNVYELIELGRLDILEQTPVSVSTLLVAHQNHRYSPLQYSIIWKEHQMFSFLLDSLLRSAIIEIRSHIRDLIAVAVKCGNLPALKTIFRRCGRQVFTKQQYLSLAARHNASFEILSFLFDAVGLKSEMETSFDPIIASILVNLPGPFYFFALSEPAKLTRFDSQIGTTPLLFLLQKQRLRMLLDAVDCIPALVDLTDDCSNTLLHMIAAVGVPGAVKRLLEAGADLNAVNTANQTPLQSIFFNERDGRLLRLFSAGKQRVFAELLESGTSIFAGESGHSVFDLISASQAMWAVEHVLKFEEAEEFIGRVGREAQSWLLAEGLLRQGVSLEFDSWRVDWNEILQNDCHFCLRHRVLLEAAPTNLMHHAAQHGATGIIVALDEAGVDVNVRDEEEFDFSFLSALQDFDVHLRKLVGKKLRPLEYAIVAKNLDTIEAILQCRSFSSQYYLSLRMVPNPEVLQLLVLSDRLDFSLIKGECCVLELFTAWNNLETSNQSVDVVEAMNLAARKILKNSKKNKRNAETIAAYLKGYQMRMLK